RQTPNPKEAPSYKHQTPNRTREFPFWNLSIGIALVLGIWCWGFHSIRERQRYDRAVEKRIDMAGWGTWVAENRYGVGAVNVFVTPARNEKSGAGGKNDVVRQQRSPFEPRAAIEREVVAGLVGEQHQLSRFGRDGANVVHVDEAFQLRQNIGVESIPENEDRKSTRLNSSHVAISYAVFCLKKKR